MLRPSLIVPAALAGALMALAPHGPIEAHPRHHRPSGESDATETAAGRVFHDVNHNRQFDEEDEPLAGVGVSNGREIVETGPRGRYELPVGDDTIIFVIKPRGYQPPLNESMLPQFYYVHKPDGSRESEVPGVEPTGPLPDSVDFPMDEVEEPDRFSSIFFGDPQPRNQQEINYIAHDVVEDLIGTDAAFGVTLGDIMFDDISLFESLNRTIARIGIPWYNVIGNHDLNFGTDRDRYSDETFERVYGPTYYSFNYGPVHFLALDDVVWLGRDSDQHYISGLGERQLEFIRNDLQRVPEDRLVVLMMHIPLVDSTPWKEEERQQLFRLIEDRPHCISIAAHEHHHEHRFIGEEDGWRGAKKHHHIVNVTVSGAWWRGAPNEYNTPHAMMADGAPNGYSVMTFDGTEYRLRFQAAGRPADFQMHIHAPEAVAVGETGGTPVYANVFNALPDARVTMRINRNGQWSSMTRVLEPDPVFVRMKRFEEQIEKRPWRDPPSPKPSPHLWRGTLPEDLEPGTHLITVRAQTQDGQRVTGRRIIRIVEDEATAEE